MARILYAVHGEGMGHATRSKVVIDYLLKKGHEVIIVSGDRAFDFLSKKFKNVYNIDCYKIIYENNSVQNIKTSIANIRKFPSALIKNFKQLIKIIIKFEPEIVITDFEPFSNFISRFIKMPVIAIDNISMVNKGKVHIPLSEIHSYAVAMFITKLWMRIKADKHIIPSFFNVELKDPERTVIIPSILRNEILKAKPREGEHIIVYQTSITNDSLLSELKKINEKFLIYGFDSNKKDKNLTFRKFDEKGFISDLASCKALIANGGFTTISEAIYLKKPILSIPVRKQFEQIMNASYVQKLGYGEYHKSVNREKIQSFIEKLPGYRQNLGKYRHDSNKMLFREVDTALSNLLKK